MNILVLISYNVLLIITIFGAYCYTKKFLSKKERIKKAISQSEARYAEKLEKLSGPLIKHLMQRYSLTEQEFCDQFQRKTTYLSHPERMGKICFSSKNSNFELYPQILFIFVNGALYDQYIDLIECPWDEKITS